MQYKIQDIVLAKDLIIETLTAMVDQGIIDVDLDEVDFDNSALKALEKEFLNGPEEVDTSTEGLWRRGIRLVTCAVYKDGCLVIDDDMEIVCRMYVGKSEDGD